MNIKESLKKFWKYLKKDTWDSWLVSLILMVIIIKFVFFPILTLATGSALPLVIVESCSMYHESSFEDWWGKNSVFYESHNIQKADFESFSTKNGFAKGDIFIVIKKSSYKIGDIIIFKPNADALTNRPIIHRVINLDPTQTKGDHNSAQLIPGNNAENLDETNVNQNNIIGKATLKIPFVGWAKLIFFDFLKPKGQRGFCK